MKKKLIAVGFEKIWLFPRFFFGNIFDCKIELGIGTVMGIGSSTETMGGAT